MEKKTVAVGGLLIGEGMPKICVPMTGTSVEALCAEAEALREAGAQMAEWRMDWFEAWEDETAVAEALRRLRNSLGTLPLLATFRTKAEGGQSDISPQQYRRLYEAALTSGQAELIDLELFFHQETVRELLKRAKELGVVTVLSSHDFIQTPPREEMEARLRRMEDMGGDIVKIAVMPQTALDVAELLAAAAESREKLSCPVVAISMGGLGVASRMVGQIFGSAITFGTVGNGSAPGQLPVQRMKEVLTWIHEAQ